MPVQKKSGNLLKELHMFLYAYDTILCSAANTVNSGNWFTQFKVLTLNVAMLTMFLHLNNFGLGLTSIADFSNPKARAPTSAEHIPCLPM